MGRDTAAYYDYLSIWTTVARWFGYGGGHADGTVHRLLADPAANGHPTATRLHDLLAEALPPPGRPRVLDAGCGLGGTMVDLARRWGGRYVGITLSPSQAAIGQRAIARAGLADVVHIAVQSYDTPPAGPFDRIIAIESLAHAADPVASLRALSRQLADGGLLAVVDDMPLAAAGSDPGAVRDLATFKSGWQCPVLLSHDGYLDALAACGLALVSDRDLSGDYQPRPLARIAWLTVVNRIARALIPFAGWRIVMDSYLGGLALERLYHRRAVSYRLLVARRTASASAPAPGLA